MRVARTRSLRRKGVYVEKDQPSLVSKRGNISAGKIDFEFLAELS